MKTSSILFILVNILFASCQTAPVQEATLMPKRIGTYSGFTNTNGELVIPAIYDKVNDFKDGWASVRKDGLWGFINEQGDTMINFEYDFVEPFANGYAPAKKDGQWSLIDRQGASIELAKEWTDSSATAHFVPSLKDDRWFFITPDGEWLDPALTGNGASTQASSVVP